MSESLITNKDASNPSIERTLKRKGLTPDRIERYLHGWLKVKHYKEENKID